MTSPDQLPYRLNQAGSLVGGDKPQLAFALASSDLSDTELGAVGGFANAMSLATANRLAQESGAQTNFTDHENNALSAVGEPTKPKPADSRSFLEKAVAAFAGAVSNTGNWLLHNPVTGALEDVGEFIGNVAHYPFRLLSSGLDTSNDDEVDRQMRADGYDPESTASYLAFMFRQGESLYHNLDKARAAYGDDLVDKVIQAQHDPDGFYASIQQMDGAAAQKLLDLTNSAEWKAAYAAVDAEHISPGRDLARVLTGGHTQNKGFRLLSGVLDGAYDWFTDPTLILGKATRIAHGIDAVTGELQGVTKLGRLGPAALLARGIDTLRGGAQRRGLSSMLDQAGIEALLRTDAQGNAVTAVGKGWQRFLDDAKALREAHEKATDTSLSTATRAEAIAQRAGIYRAMQNRYGQSLMPLLDEVTGVRQVVPETEQLAGRVDQITTGTPAGGFVTRAGAPIEDLGTLQKYLVSTNGLLRLHNGVAARRVVMMPGKLSLWAERRAAASTRAAKATAARTKWIDYTRSDILPVEAEDGLRAAMARQGDAQYALLHRSALTSVRAARAKLDRVSRRFTTLIPNVTHVDLNDATSSKLVEQIARTYLNKGDSARLASAYAFGDVAARRQIVKGVLEQSGHAAGVTRSPEGQAWLDRFLGEIDGVRQQYGLDGTSVLNTPRGQVEGALYPSQISTRVLIPSMREMNFVATKLAMGGFARYSGLGHFHALSQSSGMDHLINVIKMGWITTAAGGLRNALDEVANFATYGIGREALHGRAVFTQATRELRAERRAASREYLGMVKGSTREAVDEKIADRVHRALVSMDSAETDAAKAAAEVELHKARLLESAIRYRVPLALRSLADNVNDVLVGAALGKAMSVFGPAYRVTPEDVRYAQELVDGELTQVLREGVFQSHFADSGAMVASDDGAMGYHREGLQARRYAYTRKYLGYQEVEPDGGHGADAWAKYLQLRFADPTSPAHAWLQTVHAMAPDGVLTPEVLDAAKASLRARIDEDDLRHFVDHAEVFRQTRAGDPTAGAPALLAQAKDEWADRVSADLVTGLAAKTAKGPKVHNDLLYMLAHGQAPDRSWLVQSVARGDRPEKTIGQLWAPYNAAHEPGTFPQGYTQMLTKAYHKVVSDQINALSRNPLMTALYLNARRNTEPYVKHLTDAGWDEASAAEVAKRISLAHAQDEAFKHVDNPYVSSQFSLLGRNYFAFVRAQEDWLRRWGRTLRDNPQLIREAQLLIHGSESAGLVEKDDTGALVFVYPGSKLALDLFGKLFGAHGMPNGARVPIHGELTSQLMFLNPSLDNPVGLSATPLLSLPFRALTAFLGPDHKLLQASLDQAVNGQLGAGRKWYESMLPSWVNRIIGGLISDDPGSKFGAAYSQALANMEAAGQLDDPKLQTASGKARFQHALSVSVRNNLAMMTLFGMFAPAAPSLQPEAKGGAPSDNGTPGTGDRPDWAAHHTGLRSLKDEARAITAKLGYERALAWWQKVHPGELIYMEGGARTQIGTKSATASPTLAAATWMEHNTGFLEKYGGKGGVAAYFLPQGTPGTKDAEFSDVAYRAQLEAGIRDYKTLDEYFDDVVTARGESMYYAAKDKFDQQITEAKLAGNKQMASALQAEWDQQKAELYAGNPLLAAKQAEFATQNATAPATINQLVELVGDHSPETVKALGDNRAGLAALLTAYEDYQAGLKDLGDSRTKSATRMRDLLKQSYTERVQALAGGPTAQFPDLADLARGVFRLPN